MPLYNSDVVPDDFFRMRTPFTIGPMLDLVRGAEKHLESYPLVDSVKFPHFISGFDVFEDNDGPVSIVVKRIFVFRAEFVQRVQFFHEFNVLLWVFLEFELIETLQLLLIFGVERLHFLYNKCFFILELPNFSPDPGQKILHFIAFQVFEEQAEICDVGFGGVPHFEPFDDEERKHIGHKQNQKGNRS